MPRPPADRAALAESAGQLLNRSGIQATSVDELAVAAGVTKLTLYRHFGSKEALLVDALERRHASRQAELELALGSAGDDWRAGVMAVFDWLDGWVRDSAFHGCAFVQARVELGDRAPAVREIAMVHKRAFVRALQAHLRRARVADAALLAAQLQVLVEGATTLAFVDGDARHVASARRAAETLLDGAEEA